MNPDSIAENREWFASSYGVSNRKDLLALLDTFKRGSTEQHEFEQLSERLRRMSSQEIEALKKSRPDPAWAAKIDAAQAIMTKYPKTGIRANDWVRIILLCRMGYAVGYLTEQETLSRGLEAAKQIQSNYDSWNSMVENYMLGRDFMYDYMFRNAEGLDYRKDCYAKAQRLLNDKKRPMSKLSFKGTKL